MKRLMISMLALLLTGGIATAQSLSVADVEATPGETVTVAVDLVGGKAATYTAFQFRTATAAAGITVAGCASSADWSAKGVAAAINGDGYTNFASEEAIAASNVEGVVTVNFKIDDSVVPGIYEVTIKDGYFAYGTTGESYRDEVADVTFKITVVEAIVLDENSTVAPEEKVRTGATVKVLRTIHADELSTIVLPFEMTEEQVKSAFGDDVELFEFEGITHDGPEGTEPDDEVSSITVNFSTRNVADGMLANHPYVIRVKSDISEFTIKNVTVNPLPEDELTVNQNEFAVKDKKGKIKYYAYNSLMGTYKKMVLDEDYYFLSENKFWYSTGATTIKAFRAYFSFYVYLNEHSAPIKFRFDGEDATAIDVITTGKSTVDGIFDMSGRKIENTQRGLNIVDGKKVYVNE
ncbi:MAG: hypothetical protein IJ557_10265 [Bacteroidaceae bacterium]|nr:hypothetical protein [Bacteroidaceae bacterium]